MRYDLWNKDTYQNNEIDSKSLFLSCRIIILKMWLYFLAHLGNRL